MKPRFNHFSTLEKFWTPISIQTVKDQPDISTYLFGFRCAIDKIEGIEKQTQGDENQLKTQENQPLRAEQQADPKMPDAGEDKKPFIGQKIYYALPDGRIIYD